MTEDTIFSHSGVSTFSYHTETQIIAPVASLFTRNITPAAWELQIRRLTHSLHVTRGFTASVEQNAVNCTNQIFHNDQVRPPGHSDLYPRHTCLEDSTRAWQPRRGTVRVGKANVWLYDYFVGRPLMYGLTKIEQFPCDRYCSEYYPSL